jgi:Lrp/AsnC family transcriptional regulator, leucine-responsive regulatory protein
MATIRTLDRKDIKILNILQKDARVTNADIARVVGLAPSAVLERVRKLEQAGVVRGYTAVVEPRTLGYRMLAFVAVRTADQPVEERIGRSLARIPEVLEVHHVAGDDCFLVKLRARDAEHIGELLKTKIGRIPGVRSTRTTIVLGTEKETSALPIGIDESEGERP